uniref:Peptidase aspartic putative domain-containing protein n=1 Tax=Anopheles epiroticus TaxID=199890 RepID=A0A182PX52_9DIPT
MHKVRYVIPHSCVIKPDSTTTKLRVVFDASARSIKVLQAVGPVIQPDLIHIWLEFRTHTVVATADIIKMYGQESLTRGCSASYGVITHKNPLKCIGSVPSHMAKLHHLILHAGHSTNPER